MAEKTKKNLNSGKVKLGSICGVLLIILFLSIFISIGGNGLKLTFALIKGKGTLRVGTDIAQESITEFYYTKSASTYPPSYQRYRFYLENGVWKFYHEERNGSDWPLTEADITASGTKELSDMDVKEMFELLNGGSVKKRREQKSAGGSSPWLYLYWNGDRNKYQEYTFMSEKKRMLFEEFCKEIKVESQS